MRKPLLVALGLVIALFGVACIKESTTAVANEGFVVFEVEPSDAEVWVDGRLEGEAGDFTGRRKVLQLSSGRHGLEIKKEGYETHRQELFAGAGAKQTVTVRLRPLAQE